VKKILYIAWDGPHVSYLEGLFLPILAGLRKNGYEFHIMHFSWADPDALTRIGEACESNSVPYLPVHVKTKPHPVLGKLWTLFSAPDKVFDYLKRNDIRWVMPRTMMPAQIVLKVLKRMPDLNILFDADGLPIEERLDFTGLKKNGFRYRQLKRIESQIIARAVRVMTRSNEAIEILTQQYGHREKFYKVLNGRDVQLFRKSTALEIENLKATLGIPREAWVVVYSGSLGAPYSVNEMIQLQKLILERRPDAWWLVLTGNPDYFQSLPCPQMIVKRVSPQEVPAYLSLATLAMALRKPAFSMKGVSPIKLGEYLLMGIPAIASSGIGDTEKILRDKPFCYLLKDFSTAELQNAANWAVQHADHVDTHAERECGIENFGLEKALEGYREVLTSPPAPLRDVEG
jgi:glycosyltransferase involved in cell wall biosynthesis